MKNRPTPTNAEIAAAVTLMAGNIEAAAKKLGIARPTVYNRMKQKTGGAAIAQAIEDSREALNDDARSVIAFFIRGAKGFDDPALRLKAASFYLVNSPLGKRDGWGTRTEMTGANGGPLAVVGAIATYKVESDEAGNIFDILAATGAFAARPDAAAPDEVHTGVGRDEHLPEASGVPAAAAP